MAYVNIIPIKESLSNILLHYSPLPVSKFKLLWGVLCTGPPPVPSGKVRAVSGLPGLDRPGATKTGTHRDSTNAESSGTST